MKITELKKKALETCKGNWAMLLGITILLFLISIAIISRGTIGGVVTMFSIYPLIYFIYIKCLILKRNNKNGAKLREVNITLRMAWNYIKYNLWILLLSMPVILLLFLVGWFTFARLGYKCTIGDITSNSVIGSIIIVCLSIIITFVYLIYINLLYSLTVYVIAENNECDSALKLMKEARLLIKGNILKYIFFKLSFSGWVILPMIIPIIALPLLLPFLKFAGFGLTYILWAILPNVIIMALYLWLFPYFELAKIELYYSLKENKEKLLLLAE